MFIVVSTVDVACGDFVNQDVHIVVDVYVIFPVGELLCEHAASILFASSQ
jgi:hypothetical protein